MIVKKAFLLNLAFGVVLLSLCGLSQFKPVGVLAVLVFAAYVYISVVIWKTPIVWKYIHLSFSAAFLIMGLLVCEYGGFWLGELGRRSYYVGAIPAILFYFWALLNAMTVLDSYWGKVTRRGEVKFSVDNLMLNGWFVRNAPALVFVFNALLFLRVARTPFFLVGAENRFDYAANYMSRAVSLLRLLPCLFNAILIIPVIQDSRDGTVNFKRLLQRVFLPSVPYVLFMVWTGNKFGSFMDVLCLILIPVVAVTDFKKVNMKRLFKSMLFILGIFLAFLYLFYSLGGMSLFEASDTILQRTACQGELWWSAYEAVQTHGPQPQELSKELSYIADSFVTEGASRTYGVFHLMNLFGRPSVVKDYLRDGIRFSAYGIELPYLYFGFISCLLIPVLYGNLYALFVNLYVNSVKEKRLMSCIATGRLFQVISSAISQGDWYSYTSLIPLACLFVIMTVYVLPWRNTGKATAGAHFNSSS